jgi:hypothetical protein
MVARIAAAVSSRAMVPVNRLLDRLERAMVPREVTFDRQLVFIVGVPRSGTTLLTQALLTRFRFAYLSNFHCRFSGAPLLADRWLRRPATIRGAGPFESRYGATRGPAGPSECGEFWYRWFPREPQWASLTPAQAARLWSLRSVLAEFQERWSAPLLLKNLVNTVRLEALGQLLPEAVFVVCRRERLATAASILVGRRASRAPHRWWSVQPRGYREWLDLPIEAQVARQVVALEQEIERRMGTLGPERFHRVSYEEFCSDPRAELDRIRRFLEGRGRPLEVRGEVPAHFPAPKPPTLLPEEVDRLRNELADLTLGTA